MSSAFLLDWTYALARQIASGLCSRIQGGQLGSRHQGAVTSN